MFLAYKYGPGTQGPGTILSSRIVSMRYKQAKMGSKSLCKRKKEFSKLTILVPF